MDWCIDIPYSRRPLSLATIKVSLTKSTVLSSLSCAFCAVDILNQFCQPIYIKTLCDSDSYFGFDSQQRSAYNRQLIKHALIPGVVELFPFSAGIIDSILNVQLVISVHIKSKSNWFGDSSYKHALASDNFFKAAVDGWPNLSPADFR